jgi:hypothetical protein
MAGPGAEATRFLGRRPVMNWSKPIPRIEETHGDVVSTLPDFDGQWAGNSSVVSQQKDPSAKPHSGENLYRIEGTIHGNSGY